MESLNGIKKIIRELDPKLSRTDDGYKVATILLSSALNEQKTPADVAKFTKLPQDFVAKVMRRISRNGLGWKRGKFVHSGWDDKETGGAAFWMDVGIGLGWFKKST